MTDLIFSDWEITEAQQNNSKLDLVNYDSSLLSSAKANWVMGNWEELATMDKSKLISHPDRANVVLLIGAAYQQLADIDEARRYFQLAKSWGCEQTLINKVLISGLLNSLGKTHALNNDMEKAVTIFNEALELILEKQDASQFCQTRAITELSNLGLLPEMSNLLSGEYKKIQSENRYSSFLAKSKILETEIELINHNIALMHKKGQLFSDKSNSATEETFEERIKKFSPSQLGQDLWVLSMTSYKRNGFFIEFGATDGILLSNTYLLEKEFGWSGLLAEPNPKYYKELIKNRDCICSNACISTQSGEEVQFVLAEEFGGIDEFASEGKHKDKVEAFKEQQKILNLSTISLKDFLVEHNAPKQIDYLSVDTEGSEYSILKSFPFDEWDIKLITIEHNYEPQRELILNLMTKFGYKRLESQWDDWYYKEH